MINLAQVVQRGSADRLKAPIICVHGKGGVGKTTFACAAPNTLMIPVEDGLGVLEADPNLNLMPVPATYQEVEDTIDALIAQEHTFKWVAIDSITALEKKLWTELCVKYRQESIESFGYGKGYTMALEIMNRLVLKMRQLRDMKNVGVIIIAHSMPKSMNPPDKDPFDYYQIQVQQKLADFIHTQCDLVGFAEKELSVKADTSGFASNKGKAVETGRRLLHCYSSEKFSSKNRYRMEDMRPIEFTFNALMEAIGRQIPAQVPPTQEA